MHNTNPLPRMRLASRLCIAGAWITLVLGLILVVLFYTLSNVGNGLGGGPGLGIFIFAELIIVMLSTFFFLVLYGIGAFLNYMGAAKSTFEEGVLPARMRNRQEQDGSQLEITPLQRER